MGEYREELLEIADMAGDLQCRCLRNEPASGDVVEKTLRLIERLALLLEKAA